VKNALQLVLGNSSLMAAVRQRMVVAPDLLFLCNPLPFDLNGTTTAKVRELNALLRRVVAEPAVESKPVGTGPGTSAALGRYQRAARWSGLAAWSPTEKAAHFVFALGLDPTNRHAVDRLAASLTEAAAATTSPPRPFARAKQLLLHYAVLRGILVHPLQRPLHLVRGLTAAPLWPSTRPDLFPWLATVVDPRNVAAMKQSLPAAGAWAEDAGVVVAAQAEGVHLGDWSEIHLIEAGQTNATNAGRFPAIMDVLSRSGGDFVNARLSVLHPGAHITAHCGVSNAKLRAHVGLRVPEHGRAPPSGIVVGGQRQGWGENAAFVFDDSFEHEVWWLPTADDASCAARGGSESTKATHRRCSSDGDERVVLILDVWHPELSESEKTRARQQFVTNNLPGEHVRGDHVRCTRHAPKLFGVRGIIRGRGQSDQNMISVQMEGSAAQALDLWPHELLREDEWATRLVGGFERGDAVVTVLAQSSGRTSRLGAEEHGFVIGPSADGLGLLVHFDGGRIWNVLPETIARTDGAAPRPTARPLLRPARRSGLQLEILADDPTIFHVDNFLTPEEAEELITMGAPSLRPSQLQGHEWAGPRRTSSTGFLTGPDSWHPSVLALLRRAASIGGVPWTHSEGVQVVRYLHGETFADHQDWFLPNASDADPRAGQRVLSVLVYLSDAFSGGETTFPRLNLTILPKIGRAVFWRNVDGTRSDHPDSRVLHRGEMVTDGVKWAANLWFTEHPFETYRTAVT
jgi:prolyl 4-hydroxylase